MKKETYLYFSKKIAQLPHGALLVNIVGKCLTYLTAFSYLSVLLFLLFQRRYLEGAVLLFVPMVTFFLVSLFRSSYGAKRPYEIYDIEPLIKKETVKKSFPSRHVFSIYVIGTSLCFFSLPLGIAICAAGLILAVIRVVTAVHFPKDVICGAILGVLSGCMVKVVLAVFGG